MKQKVFDADLDALHHVAIPVENVARAVDWYRNQFRVRIAYQDETWALLKFANTSLALVVPGQHPPHIGVVHPDARSFGELKTHRDGTASIYLKDSEGNAVEILEDNAYV
ncbi:VOC family protein [Thioalkalivibrio sulfidiphilus]|uniref:Glyoxalase/bleomycin resistance protein/dioxygenase n=1 Tax=Thioalkalivibrio sulfidiphilus (strain HL-EbGR7) TaxID=396588 RepID=B8GR50_THISH|nr:VOC family protein [Thioalkalivibrio sulfidiphilus]ACL72470.1 glyoxalase/bleomycin resistance protein/dioxygenase [Thioalkalivibrio sulfidiphilus HL-EbGr7]